MDSANESELAVRDLRRLCPVGDSTPGIHMFMAFHGAGVYLRPSDSTLSSFIRTDRLICLADRQRPAHLPLACMFLCSRVQQLRYSFPQTAEMGAWIRDGSRSDWAKVSSRSFALKLMLCNRAKLGPAKVSARTRGFAIIDQDSSSSIRSIGRLFQHRNS